MKKLTFFFLFFLVFQATLFSQPTTYTVGPSSMDFSTLKEAFDYINIGATTGEIILEIIENIDESSGSGAVLNSSGGSVNYTSILIYPTAPGLTINGNADGPLIDFNGAENVIFDGRVNRTGTTDLTISNSSTHADASTIRFTNSATNNIVQYCTLKGSGTGSASGVVLFTNGNDHNVLDNNNITGGTAGRPVNAIFSLGSPAENIENTISNNTIYDFLNEGLSSAGINLDANSTKWTIIGNSFYETNTFTPTANTDYKVIRIYSPTGGGFDISGNYIGGSEALNGGTSWVKSNAFNNSFEAIYLNAGTLVVTNIQNNTIQNFDWANSGAASWTGINIEAGSANIGTITGNSIGSSTGIASIVVSGGANNSTVKGINIATSGNVDCQKNTIGSITISSSGSSLAANFYGIIKTATPGETKIINNLIGSTSSANSIAANSSSTANAQNVIGIFNNGTGTITITGNTLSNLVNNCTFISTTQGQIAGIITKNGSNTISGNTVSFMSAANANSGNNESSSVIGISLTSTVSGQNVSANFINNLSNTHSGTNITRVTGLNYAGGTGGVNLVERNFIHSLSLASTNVSSSLSGIRITSGATTFANNIISVGIETLNPQIYGIYETGASGNITNLYFNTIYISGSTASGSSDSYALFSNANTNLRNFRNNIFSNSRSGGTGNHYAAYFNSDNTNLTLDFNDYYAPGTGGLLGYYSAGRSSLPVVTGHDASSKALNPLFANAGGTSTSDYIISETDLRTGTTITITTDYNGAARAPAPTMGALETGPCSNPSAGGIVASDQNGCSPFDPAAFTSTTLPSGFIGPALEYKWQQSITGSTSGFTDIPGSNAANYDPGSLTQKTWYKRIAKANCMTDWLGAAESNVVVATVNTPPVANAITGDNVVCMANSLALNSNATGTPVLSYTWFSSNTSVATVDNSGIVTPVALGTTNITYKVTDGSGSSCQATSANHIVTVNSLPVANPITGGNTVCTGTTLVLTPHATGNPGLTYTWSSSDTDVATITTSGEVIPVSSGTTIIRYTVTDASSSSCQAISAAYPMTVSNSPVAGAITGDNEVCAGGTIILTPHATGTPTLTYTWTSSNTSVATVDNSGVVTSVSGGTANITYTVTDGSPSLCSSTSPVFPVTINALPLVSLSVNSPGSVCSGNSADIIVSNSASGIIYQLRNASGNVNIGSPVPGNGGTIILTTGSLTSNTTFNILATDIVTNCFSVLAETESLTVDPVSVGGSIAGINSSVVYGSSTGTLVLNGNTGNVSGWERMGAAGTWENISNTLTTYVESPSSSGIWKYRATVKSGSCPEAISDVFSIDVSKKLLVITANNQSKTYGAAFSFVGTEYSSNGLINNDAITSVSITSPGSSATASVSGSPYLITPSAAIGTGLENYNITFNDGAFSLIKANLTFTADNKLKEYLTENPVLTYTISGFVNSETSSILNILPSIHTDVNVNTPAGNYPIIFTGGSDDNYTYAFIEGILAVTRISQTITFNDYPEKLLINENYTLNASSSKGLPIFFESLDKEIADVDGNVITGLSKGIARIRAFNPGDQNYDSSESFVSVEIYSTHKDIKNLFTPNNDGINDFWELPDLDTWGVSDVKVYNRWGKLVFSEKNYRNLWDGRSNGSPLPEGPYYFIIITENSGTIKGTVNIIR